jgi:RNA polymerase sigma factor (sigma-70 family)
MTTEPNSVDWELLSRAYEGDDAAFDLLVRKLRPKLYRYVRQLLSNEEDMEDAVQTALMALYKVRLKQKNPYSTVSGWLHVVCKNACMDIIRHRGPAGLTDWSNESDDGSGSSDLDLLPSFRDEYRKLLCARDEHGEVEQTLDFERVRACLETLPPQERHVVELRYLTDLDLTYEEIGGILRLGKSAKANAKKCDDRAIRKLQDCLGLTPDDSGGGQRRV